MNMGGAGMGGFDSRGFSGSTFNDMFGDIFGDLFGAGTGSRKKRRRSHGRPGADLKTSVDITFEESAFGVEKIITVPKMIRCESCDGTGAKPGTNTEECNQCGGEGELTYQQGFFAITRPCSRCNGEGKTISHPCLSCHGTGQAKKKSQIAIKVPAGVDSGQRLKLNNEGEVGERGGPPGDLYVVINVLEHEFFKREEFDVLCDVPITFAQAALGSEIDVPTLQGKIKMKIPLGTQSHNIFRLKGKGLPRLGMYGRGDQLVRIIVETPINLSADQRELLTTFEKLDSASVHPKHHSFFEKVKNIFG